MVSHYENELQGYHKDESRLENGKLHNDILFLLAESIIAHLIEPIHSTD